MFKIRTYLVFALALVLPGCFGADRYCQIESANVCFVGFTKAEIQNVADFQLVTLTDIDEVSYAFYLGNYPQIPEDNVIKGTVIFDGKEFPILHWTDEGGLNVVFDLGSGHADGSWKWSKVHAMILSQPLDEAVKSIDRLVHFEN